MFGILFNSLLSSDIYLSEQPEVTAAGTLCLKAFLFLSTNVLFWTYYFIFLLSHCDFNVYLICLATSHEFTYANARFLRHRIFIAWRSFPSLYIKSFKYAGVTVE